MSGSAADEGRDWTDAVTRLSVGVGVLYFVGYAVYVVTEWDPTFYLPPVALLGYLLSRSAIADLWHCDRCEKPTVSRACPTCDAALLGSGSALRVVGLYAWVVPGGAVAVEVLLVFCQALAFSLLGWVPVVAWYQRQWLDVTGFTGPLPLFVYTLVSAMVVALVAVAIRTVQAGATSLLLDR